MRFTAGVIVGVLIGRPVLAMINEHLSPPVKKKIAKTINNLANRLNATLEQESH